MIKSQGVDVVRKEVDRGSASAAKAGLDPSDARVVISFNAKKFFAGGSSEHEGAVLAIYCSQSRA